MVDLILDAGLAVLAVFGGYCLIRLISDALFHSERIVTAILLEEERDLDLLPTLLLTASEARFLRGKEALVLLVREELLRDGRLREAMRELDGSVTVFLCGEIGDVPAGFYGSTENESEDEEEKR